MTWRGAPFLALAAAALGPAAGCGSNDAVEQIEERVARELSTQLERQRAREQQLRAAGGLDPGPPSTPVAKRVDCPDTARTETGASFRCEALDAKGRAVGSVLVVMLPDERPSWQFTVATP